MINAPLIDESAKTACASLAKGNEAFRHGNFAQAISQYAQVIFQQPELAKSISANLSIARQKYRINRQASPKPSVAVCGWELAHNAAGRAYTLAIVYETFAQVEIIGSLFPRFGREVWEPIRDTAIAKHTFVVEDESKFIEQAIQLVAAHPYDIVHLSKPRAPNVFIGILYKLLWGAKVLMDIDDEELAFVGAEAPISIDDYIQQHGKLPELKDLAGKDWTRLAVGLAREFDGLTVCNAALQERYGGEIIRHARNKKLFKPSPDLKRQSRERYGIPQDATVVLFFGTPRDHKGLIKTAQTIASLKRIDVIYCIVGSFLDESLKQRLLEVENCNYRFLPNQSINKTPEILAIADCYVALQEVNSIAAQYQTPAKLSDAIMMDLEIFAEETKGLKDLIALADNNNEILKITQNNLMYFLSSNRRLLPLNKEKNSTLKNLLSTTQNGVSLKNLVSNIKKKTAAELLHTFIKYYGFCFDELKNNIEEIENLTIKCKANMSCNGIKFANSMLRKGNLIESIESYDQLMRKKNICPAIKNAIQFNISIAEKYLRKSSTYPKNARIVVYTCNFGDYESIKEPRQIDESVDYVLFTENEKLTSKNWHVKVINNYGHDPRRASRLPKILPHMYLPDYDFSIYIDSSLELLSHDVRLMVAECLADEDIALFRHYKRNCVYDEIDCVLNDKDRKLSNPKKAHSILNKYKDMKYPKNNGLFENAIIFRRHNSNVAKLNEIWWREFADGPERDQFTFMYALQEARIWPRTIKRGKQFRDNPFVVFHKHEYKTFPVATGQCFQGFQKLFAIIAYAPTAYGQNLGRAYNEYMGLLGENDVALFLDHDAMFCDDAWADLVREIFRKNQDQELLLIGMANRIGKPYQRIGLLEDDHCFEHHALLTEVIRGDLRDKIHDVTRMTSASGVVMVISKKTWNKSRFVDGFLKVDNRQHLSIRAIGGQVLMVPGLYTYHFYRADGDLSHAKKITEITPDIASSREDRIKLKSFVLSPSQGLDVAHYMTLLQDDDWVVFLSNGATFCDKYWYPRIYNFLEGEDGSRIVALGNNAITPGAPEIDDVLVHRSFAAETIDRDLPITPIPSGSVSSRHFAGFVLSKRLYGALASEGQLQLDGLVRLAASNKCSVVRWDAVYVYAPLMMRELETLATARGLLEYCSKDKAISEISPRSTYSNALAQRRRVAILTLGFWPNHAGMEMMIHNLALELTRGGDLVTLFTPQPTVEFDEIPHTYLLRRYKTEKHLEAIFAEEHGSIPFDVVLVQGAYEAASLARKLASPHNIPIVLRTHGEDIQIDRQSNYGYRLHPMKGAVIEDNVRTVDHNVVIGSHLVEEIRSIDPAAPVSIIHNGVDTDRFAGERSHALHDRLGLPHHTRIVLTVGRNVRKKSFHLALDAFALVSKEMPDAVLVHAGKPGNGEDLMAHARLLGIEDRFFMLGTTNYFDMPDIYASSEIFLFPSKTETFGNVTVEAMAAGLPCVEFDYVVNREKIDDGVSGYIVLYGDVNQLAARAVELLVDDERRTAFSRAAREAALLRFSWRSVAQKYRHAFELAILARGSAAKVAIMQTGSASIRKCN